ncbi:hypothetical protein BC833DRAFT_612905 [Globomyces pollinis-pini]|nr:hypothetical protein BC833DRAFT_612905 [Globomyces pollinis-pini]
MYPTDLLLKAPSEPATIEKMCTESCFVSGINFGNNVIPACGDKAIFPDGTTAFDFWSQIGVLHDGSCTLEPIEEESNGCYSSQMRFLSTKNFILDYKMITNLINLRGARVNKADYCDLCIAQERDFMEFAKPFVSKSVLADVTALAKFIDNQCGPLPISGKSWSGGILGGEKEAEEPIQTIEPVPVALPGEEKSGMWDALENSSLVGDGSADVKLPVACQNALDDPINNIWTACLNRPNRFPVKDLVESARTIKIIGLLGTTKAAQCAANLVNYKNNVLPACGGNGQQIIFHEGDTTALDFYSEVDLLRRIAAIKLAVPAGADNCYHAQLLTLEDRLFPIDAKISTNLINLRALRSNPSFFCGIGTNQCVALEFAELKTALNTAGYSKMVNDDIIELRKFISRACSLPLSEPVDDEVEVEPPVSGSIESIPGLLGVAAGAMSLLMV